ncbi:hypothetical protein KPL70_004910 [Citrus sinensis]|uniref:Uncharacterized protein n=2 Tax=Citrus sinensis TaxID=2711 RepID=A0ACB8NFM5_CITSI|nr:polyadenylate-binding protein RBP45 isoform X2 [Citrus sinensis]KAH9748058.1 hypothetical protein KPL70_004910 [Citrus sinensis]KAH9796384.1 hypothetical protein KPL71_005514 [Citrus sinensis]KDO75472.1 hypothetical protein CISIN_1g015091mg [Citrus sinensis]
MMQPAPGAVPPPPPPMAAHQYQYQQQAPPQQQPPPQPSPYMMMMPPQPQAQPPAMWATQAAAPQAAGVAVPPQQQGQPGEIRTLWIGDLQYWMDETYLNTCFAHTGEVVAVKVIRNKQTGQIEGYGFIEFISRAGAERVLQTFNGTPMPNGEQNFRLNWASFGAGEKRDDTPDHTIFVGDLAADVTDYMLQETFRARYPSTKGAKVVIDRLTGRTKGYGFVRFGDESEQLRAMTEMNGVFCSTRPMRIGPATNKKTVSASYQNSQVAQSDDDPNNTTVFVGNLDSIVTDEHLRELFSQYGQLVHVKIPAGKRCGFVQFADRSCAEEALRMLNGTQLGGQNIRLSWGRSPSNKQAQPDPNQWNAGYYGYAQGYENYGYAAAAPQDPSMYYGGYPGYGNYQQPQQPQQ